MKIKKIKKLSSNKYKIEFEDATSITTYDNVILENNILLKKEIDSETYIKLSSENSYYEIYNKAVKYIVTKLRSEKEIRDYIKKYTDEQALIEKIITQLKKEGLLNDERYIKAFIEDKVNLTSWGPHKIEKELEKMELDPEMIQLYLSKYDSKIFEDKIKKIINKKIKTNKKDSSYILKQKIERDLYDLGYPSDIIKDNMEEVKVDNTTILENEFFKIHNKLSKKYNGNELKYQVKNRLYQKGFPIDEINNMLEKNI